MRIAGIRHAVPTRRITNEWIIQTIRRSNQGRLTADQLAVLDQRLRAYLAAAGTKVRYYLNEGEKAIDFVRQAGHDALQEADVSPTSVDFLIYTGVGRGWVEPAMASVVQAELRLGNATCFDISDACAGWMRALQVAHSLIHANTYRCGMIVNCECGLYDSYGDWELDDVRELEYRFAGLTIGEAATATIVSDENPNDDFYFNFKTYGEHLALCMIPLPGVEKFLSGTIDEYCVPGKFFTRSRALVGTTVGKIVESFTSDQRLGGQKYDIIFGHEASEKASEEVGRRLDLPYDRYFSTHRYYGNTVSASIPLGMSLALKENRLKRGDKVLTIVGSAGITVGFATFTF